MEGMVEKAALQARRVLLAALPTAAAIYSACLNPSIFWSLPSNLNSFLVAYFLTNTTNVLFTCSAKGAFTDVQTSCFIFVFEFCIFLRLYHYICICMIIPQLVEDGRAGQADARRLQTSRFIIQPSQWL